MAGEKELRDVFEDVSEFEKSALPADSLLFPKGVIEPRSVFHFSLGNIEVWKIRMKEGGDQSRLSQNTTVAELQAAYFVTELFAIEFAKENIKDFKAKSDADYEIIQEMHEQLASSLHDALVCIVEQAKKENAVLISGDLYYGSTGAVMLMDVLNYVDFRGPLVNVANDSWTAVEAADCSKSFLFMEPGSHSKETYTKQVLVDRITHSILITGDHTASCCRMTALAATMIAQGGNNTLLAIVASGGKSSLYYVAEAVRQDIPLLVLQGSGRLSDYLPEVWLQRHNSSFNAFEQSRALCRRCGFGDHVDDGVGRRVMQILKGDVMIHQLINGAPCLQRILTSVSTEYEDPALKNAVLRMTQYKSVARKISWLGDKLHALHLVLGVVLTLLATVQSQLSDVQLGSSALHYVVVVLPVVLSVVMSLRQDLNFSPKVLALEYGAALLDSEIYRYRTRTGYYSDVFLGSAKFDGKSTSLDTISARTKKLAERLVDISVNIGELEVGVDTQNVKVKEMLDQGAALFPSVGTILSALSLGKRVKARVRPDSAQPYKEKLSGNDYVKERLAAEKAASEQQARTLQRSLLALRVTTYLVGAGGSILALLNQQAWVTVTTATVAAAAAWNSAYPIEERFKLQLSIARALDDIVTQWQAVPDEKKLIQQTFDTLVDETERLLLSSVKRPANLQGQQSQARLLFAATT